MADDGLPSEKLIALFQQVQQAKTKEDRRRFMMLLGEQFAVEHDDSDETATDDVHRYFEEHTRAKLAYEQATLRIGRLAADCVQAFLLLQEAPAMEHAGISEQQQRPN